MRIATRAAVCSSGMDGINRFGSVAMPMASCPPFVRKLRGHVGGTARLCIERLQGQDRNQNNEQESQPRMHIDRWNRNYSALAGHRSTALLINHERFLTNHSASGGWTASIPHESSHLLHPDSSACRSSPHPQDGGPALIDKRRSFHDLATAIRLPAGRPIDLPHLPADVRLRPEFAARALRGFMGLRGRDGIGSLLVGIHPSRCFSGAIVLW